MVPGKNQTTKSGLNPENFIARQDGKDIGLFLLTNNKGAEITLTNYGARIVSCLVPEKSNRFVDVVLGYDSIEQYMQPVDLCFGAVCGRTANRIAKGRFTLEGKGYQLAINNGSNNLHGGCKGFNAVVWDVMQPDNQTIVFTYLSKDGEEGYPGNLTVEVLYRLTEENALEIEYSAVTDKTTIINLTNHSYFNLSGAGSDTVEDHILRIYADEYLPIDKDSIPYGKPEKVKNTPMDFTSPRAIGKCINEPFYQFAVTKGYDHNYILNKRQGELALSCYSPVTGISMEAYTTEPGLQLYVPNELTGDSITKNGKKYPARSAVCFETQHYPDSINHPEYPSTVLYPDTTFKSKTIYKFTYIQQ